MVLDALTPLMWQDLAIAVGSFVGIVTKMYALQDERTRWSRTASLTNLVFYPPSLAAFYSLDLFITFATTGTSALIWFGIYLYRAPAREDWLGRE